MMDMCYWCVEDPHPRPAHNDLANTEHARTANTSENVVGAKARVDGSRPGAELGELCLHVGQEQQADTALVEAQLEDTAGDSGGDDEGKVRRAVDDALAALEAAKAALDKLTKLEFSELKAMQKPAGTVARTCEVLCLMFGVKPIKVKDTDNAASGYFLAAKKHLLYRPETFLALVSKFDVDNVPYKSVVKIAKHMASPEFRPAIVAKASRACAALCMWTRAVYRYHQALAGRDPASPGDEGGSGAKTVGMEALMANILEKAAAKQRQIKLMANISEKAAAKQRQIKEQSVTIATEKASVNRALSEVLPAIADAVEALESLDKVDLRELKAFGSPPPMVKAVCLQVVYLRPGGNSFDENWLGVKRLLARSSLLDDLKSYPKDSITANMIKKVNAVKLQFKNPELTVENVARVSKAGHVLLMWVSAITEYYNVAKNVEPLRKKVRNVEKDVAAAEKELGELNELLGRLQLDLAAPIGSGGGVGGVAAADEDPCDPPLFSTRFAHISASPIAHRDSKAERRQFAEQRRGSRVSRKQQALGLGPWATANGGPFPPVVVEGLCMGDIGADLLLADAALIDAEQRAQKLQSMLGDMEIKPESVGGLGALCANLASCWPALAAAELAALDERGQWYWQHHLRRSARAVPVTVLCERWAGAGARNERTWTQDCAHASRFHLRPRRLVLPPASYGRPEYTAAAYGSIVHEAGSGSWRTHIVVDHDTAGSNAYLCAGVANVDEPTLRSGGGGGDALLASWPRKGDSTHEGMYLYSFYYANRFSADGSQWTEFGGRDGKAADRGAGAQRSDPLALEALSKYEIESDVPGVWARKDALDTPFGLQSAAMVTQLDELVAGRVASAQYEWSPGHARHSRPVPVRCVATVQPDGTILQARAGRPPSESDPCTARLRVSPTWCQRRVSYQVEHCAGGAGRSLWRDFSDIEERVISPLLDRLPPASPAGAGGGGAGLGAGARATAAFELLGEAYSVCRLPGGGEASSGCFVQTSAGSGRQLRIRARPAEPPLRLRRTHQEDWQRGDALVVEMVDGGEERGATLNYYRRDAGTGAEVLLGVGGTGLRGRFRIVGMVDVGQALLLPRSDVHS
eukprot:g2707.t1